MTKVTTAVVVTDTINVTIHVTATAAPVDKESDSDPSDPVYTQNGEYSKHVNIVCSYIVYEHTQDS